MAGAEGTGLVAGERRPVVSPHGPATRPARPAGPRSAGDAPQVVEQGLHHRRGELGALLLLGGIGAFIVIVFLVDRVDDVVEDAIQGSPDELDDVEVAQCRTDESGLMRATLRITNDSPERSSYVIEVEFESTDGNEQLDTGLASRRLDPGQSTETEAHSAGQAPAEEFECRVTLVNRFSDE